jgi:hypothetical protein
MTQPIKQERPTQNERKPMKKLNLLRTLAFALTCAALAISRSQVGANDGPPVNAAAIRVTTGNTFALVPTSDPNVFGHPVDGVAQVSLMGNCHFHGEATIYLPTTDGQAIRILSTSPWTLTSSDGGNSLRFDTEGTATFDPVNPSFVNLTYNVTFVGGTGRFAQARGTGTIEVTAEFTSALGGLANWTLKGVVITSPSGS